MRTAHSFVLATAVCGMILVSLAFAGAAHADPTPAAPSVIYLPLLTGGQTPPSDEPSAVAAEILALVNAERAAAGCGPLTLDTRLTAAAQSHSEDMATNNFFDHVGSNGSSPGARATAAGYNWRTVGENIAAGYTSAEAVMAGWMGSAGHRDNILNCAYTHLGVGFVYQPDDAPLAGVNWPYYRYWTQLFAAPR
ncbi:MAG: hypothetical protein OHK0015_03770 [Chloroflexi bacterium OHK40]